MDQFGPSESNAMPYRYTLRTPDGDDPGAIVLDQPATTGEEIQVSGHLRMLIRTVVPTPPSEEFLDSPCVGFVVVEPVE